MTRFFGMKLAYVVALGAFLVIAGKVEAQTSAEPLTQEVLTVPLFKSRVVKLDAPVSRVSVGNPDVADILILRASQLYVLGKDLGTTNVLLWDANDRLMDTVSVEVTHDLESLKLKLRQLLPAETIEVYSVQRSIALRGQVSSAMAVDTAMKAAGGYLAQIQTARKGAQFEQENQSRREDKTVGEVINLLQVSGAQQVMLEVKVAEIQRSELRRLDAQFNAFNREAGNWVWGGVNGGATFPDVVFPGVTLPDGTQIPAGRQPVFNGIAPWGPAIDEFAPNPMTDPEPGHIREPADQRLPVQSGDRCREGQGTGQDPCGADVDHADRSGGPLPLWR